MPNRRFVTSITSGVWAMHLIAACSVSEGLPNNAADLGSADASAPADDASAPASDEDHLQNGDETDIDCGGGSSHRCDTGKKCVVGGDCVSQVCSPALTCQTPAPDDKIKNGTETDIDCGGDTANPRCLVGKGCKAHSDCTSNGCTYAEVCAPRATCVAKNGGDTCLKADGTTESCCTSIVVPAGAIDTTPIPSFAVEKYVVTAGRMRALLERVNGNVRGWMTQNAPSWWDPRWTPWLPSSFNGHENNVYANPVTSTTVLGWSKNEDPTKLPAHALVVGNISIESAWAQVAGGVIYDNGSQGCFLGQDSVGHPTYFVDDSDAALIWGDTYKRWIPQAALDQRPINCTPWPMLAALCAFDGGQLISTAQYNFVYDDDGYTANKKTRSLYPWGTPPALVCPSGTIDGYGACCKTNALALDSTNVNKCVSGGGTWSAPANYDPVTMPHPGGYASIGGKWTLVGTGAVSFSVNPCPDCVDDWVNWRFSYQDPTLDPWAPALPADEQYRRSRDQANFISVPGRFPKGASRRFNNEENQRVQDIAGLVFNAALVSKSASFIARTMTFGDDDASNDVSVAVPNMTSNGGSWEGHAIGSSAGLPLTWKYGKLGARCVYAP